VKKKDGSFRQRTDQGRRKREKTKKGQKKREKSFLKVNGGEQKVDEAEKTGNHRSTMGKKKRRIRNKGNNDASTFNNSRKTGDKLHF